MNDRHGHRPHKRILVILVLMPLPLQQTFSSLSLHRLRYFSFISPARSATLHIVSFLLRSIRWQANCNHVSLSDIPESYSLGLPTGLDPSSNSPCKKSLRIRPSSFLRICPTHRNLRCLRRVYIQRVPALFKSKMLLETLSVHEMDRMWRKHIIWNVRKRFSCLA